MDRGLPAELQIWVELGGWEEVEVHKVAELRGAHEVHLGRACGEGLPRGIPVRLAGTEYV